MKRFAILATMLALTFAAWAETFTIYVSDQTGWSTFDLYAWGDSEAFGKWPGATDAPTVTADGTLFSMFAYWVADGKSEMTLNLIFHNNVGEGQPGDERQLITLTVPRDYFLEVSASGIRELPAPQLPEADRLEVDNTVAISRDNRVIYELNLYDFTTAGTLAAAQQRLGELRTLGIDIVWLMPIYPRGVQGKIGSLGSPYAPRDYTAVNADHGTLSDLKNFVSAAHDLGMAVWLDWVPNHTGLDHVWVTSHPEYYQWDGNAIVHPSNYGDVYQLDYSNTALCKAMTDAMLFWVNEADIDGFRCDYVSSPQIPVTYWQQAIPALQNNSRGKRVEMMGEADFTSWDAGHLYAAGFDYDYAWGFADGLKSVGTGTSVANARTAAQNLLSVLSTNYGTMSRMSYLTNHDDIGNNFSSNYITVLGSNVAPMTVMYFTFFGMPLLYSGQEIGQTKILNYFNRNAIDWNTVNTPIYNTIRSLIALKHTQPALADGTAASRATARLLTTSNSSVIAYEKTQGSNTVIVVISLSDKSETVTLSGITAGEYVCAIDSRTITAGCYTTEEVLTSTPSITLEAKGYRVYTNSLTPPKMRNCHLYVNDRTGWQTFDLYEWGTPHEIFGGWPGATSAPTAFINGITWRDYPYTVSEEMTDMEMNLIFHNNVGEGKTGDYRQLITLTEPRDYYLTVTGSGISETFVPTALEPVIGEPVTAKILHNGQVLIMRGNSVYNMLGMKINDNHKNIIP